MKTILVVILAVLSVALAGVLGYQKLSQPETTSIVVNRPATSQPIVNDQPQGGEEPLIDNNKGENATSNQNVSVDQADTKTWKNYKSEIAGAQFAIKYPNNFFSSTESKNPIAKTLMGVYLGDVSLDDVLRGKNPYFDLRITTMGGGVRNNPSVQEDKQDLELFLKIWIHATSPKLAYSG